MGIYSFSSDAEKADFGRKTLSEWRYPFSGDQVDVDDLSDYGWFSHGYWCLFERKKIYINWQGQVMLLKLKKSDHDDFKWVGSLKAQTGLKDREHILELYSNLWPGSGGFRE